MPPIEEKPQALPSNVKSNFNLSFNNSFNTSIAGANQVKPQIAVQAESSLMNGEIVKH